MGKNRVCKECGVKESPSEDWGRNSCRDCRNRQKRYAKRAIADERNAKRREAYALNPRLYIEAKLASKKKIKQEMELKSPGSWHRREMEWDRNMRLKNPEKYSSQLERQRIWKREDRRLHPEKYTKEAKVARKIELAKQKLMKYVFGED